ncbi:MAG TPA: cyclodeaminase/cyclohydrolase family protein [Thermoanaerobaculia bacterium]|nr:cyclodeaminase/cyclohydrolase family protein [Thermoanaerobaculia bacterium]
MSFLDRPAGDLLDLFAAGKTVPGAVSAAALQGALAASLLQAVARYTKAEALLKEAGERGERLRRAVDEDATAFQQYWGSRVEEDLRRAVDIPIAVAQDCAALAVLGLDLYETGFRNSRGESAAAVLGALAAGEAALYAASQNVKLSKDPGWAALRNEAITSRGRELRELRERLGNAMQG